MTTGPFETEAEAAAAARTLGGPLRPGWSILSPEQRLRVVTKACEEAGVELGAYDARFLKWLADWEDGFSGVFTRIVTRAHAAGCAAGWRRSLRGATGDGNGNDEAPSAG